MIKRTSNNLKVNFLKRHAFLVFAVILLGLLLRLWGLGSRNLWHDEAVTYFLSFHGSLPLSRSLEPPIYFLILKAWLYLVPSPTEFWMRLPSVFLSVSSVLLLYRLAKRLLDQRLALISSLILSLSPIHIWYAQEARVYALYVFEVLAMTGCFLKALEEDKLKYWLWFIVLAVLALYTNYFILFLFASQFCIALSVKRYRKKITKLLTSFAIVFFAFLPSMVKLGEKVFFVREGIWWINSKPTLQTVFMSFKNFLAGYNAPPGFFVSVALIILLASSFGFYYLFKERRDAAKSLFLLIAMPLALAFLLSRAGISVYLDRQLAAFSPFFYMVLASGVSKLPRNAYKVLLAFAYLFIIIFSLHNYYTGTMPSSSLYHMGAQTKKTIKPTVDFIRENYEIGDMIAFSNPSASVVFWYYWSKDVKSPPVHYFSSSRSDYLYKYYSLMAANRKKGESLKFCYDVEDKTQIEKIRAKRIWLVNSAWGDEDIMPQVTKVSQFLQARYKKILEKDFKGSTVILFEQERPNIILIVVDALRADHLGCYGYSRNTSPTIDGLSREGVLFEKAFSQGTSTQIALASLFTSLYPSVHRVYALQNSLPDEFVTMGETLKENGYATAAFVPYNVLASYNLQQGFDAWRAVPTTAESIKAPSKTTAKALNWLRKNRRSPFFVYIHYFGPHSPYKNPPPYDKLFWQGGVDKKTKGFFNRFDTSDRSNPIRIGSIPSGEAFYYLLSQYDGKIRYTDTALKELLDGLEHLRLSGNTLIILTADHGEEFLEHGHFLHGGGPSEELIHVPLIFRLPKVIPQGRTIPDLARHIDVMPTVLELLHIRPARGAQGISLLPLIDGGEVYPQDVFSEADFLNSKDSYRRHIKGIRTNKHKFIEAHMPSEDLYYYKLYDLEKDPGETHELTQERPQEIEFFKKKLSDYALSCEEIRGSILGKGYIEEPVVLKEPAKEKLKSLGYIQ